MLVCKLKDVSKCSYTVFDFKKQYNHEVFIVKICDVFSMEGK